MADFESDIPEITEDSDDKTQKEDTTDVSTIHDDTEQAFNIAYQDEILLSPEDPNYVQLTTQEKASGNSVRKVLKEMDGGAIFKVLRIATQENYDLSAPSVSAAPIYTDSAAFDGFVTQNVPLRAQLDTMQHNIDEAFEKAEQEHKVVVYMASGASASFAVGAASYLLRAGSLMSSFLATVPIWKGFDPVAILITPKKKKKDEDTHEPLTSTGQKAEEMFAGEKNQ